MYKINYLYGMAWENAVVNAGNVLGMDRHYSITQWVYVTAMAKKLGLQFDINGGLYNGSTDNRTVS